MRDRQLTGAWKGCISQGARVQPGRLHASQPGTWGKSPTAIACSKLGLMHAAQLAGPNLRFGGAGGAGVHNSRPSPTGEQAPCRRVHHHDELQLALQAHNYGSEPAWKPAASGAALAHLRHCLRLPGLVDVGDDGHVEGVLHHLEDAACGVGAGARGVGAGARGEGGGAG